ncbi:60S ribosomal protein L36a-like [Ursus arctos]|uniref:60S ribosomal protein L36a-like n=1 Tax=Ursus arctos TaxID=9644 RepID=UPI0020175EA6|nr:60S ribosomal protein L36a-like [Ursus arctos]
MVNIPKTHRTFRKKCAKRHPHKVTHRRKACKDCLYAQGKWHYDRKQSGWGGGGRLILFSRKRLKKIVQRLESVESNCRSERMLTIKRCKRFELGGDKRKEN